MLMGEFNHSVDAKGRLIIPSKLRDELGDNIVITKGIDTCLFVFPKNEWDEFAEKLTRLPLLNQDARKLTRHFISPADSQELDGQGRVLVPTNLRDYAQIDKNVVLVGIGKKIEIWSKELWEAASADVNIDDVITGLENLNIDL